MIPSALKTFTLVASLRCAVALIFATAASAADSVWWGNGGVGGNNFGHASTAGGEDGTFTPATAPVSTPSGLAIDSATGTAYWANQSNSTIGWAKLDGSEEGTLNTAGASVVSPLGIAIDPGAGKVYWANNNNTIAWAATDGSGGAILDTTGAPVNHAQGAVIDPVDGRVYWANREGESIGYADLDDSGEGEELEVTGTPPTHPNGLAIDAAQDRIYWTEANGSAIHYAPLGGGASGVLAVGSAPISGPRGLAIDPEAGKIYRANLGGSIGVAALDGSGGSQLDTTGATISGPTYPVVFETPKAATAPTVGGSATVGSTLTGTPGTWKGDLVESFLYRAPERTSVGWTLNGTTLNGATGTTLVANQGGTYACEGIATDGAGTTVAMSAPIVVPGPTTPAGTVSVRL
jgi:DNA-binding beta-propeller fold protein YncE